MRQQFPSPHLLSSLQVCHSGCQDCCSGVREWHCHLQHVCCSRMPARLECVSSPALQFNKILDPANVKRIVEEADGYQPHLIAPEMGYRRLLQECLVSLPPFWE